MKKSVVGLTGGIATGKSMVLKILNSLGVEIFNADDEVHQVLKLPRIKRKLIQLWGKKISTRTNQINRDKLAEIVFNNPVAKRKLEGLIHPIVIQQLKDRITQFRLQGSSRVLVCEVPLLVEAKLNKLFDYIVVIDTKPQIQKKRLLIRYQRSLNKVNLRLNSRADINRKISVADGIIPNNGNLTELKQKVVQWYQKNFS